MQSAEQQQALVLLHLVSATNGGDPRDVLVLGQGFPGLSFSQASLHPARGSLAALHTALLVHINPGHPTAVCLSICSTSGSSQQLRYTIWSSDWK